MFLNSDELKQCTGKVRRPAQVRVLQQMGIIHEIRPDGYPLVSKTHIEKRLDGTEESLNKGGEPNWEAL